MVSLSKAVKLGTKLPLSGSKIIINNTIENINKIKNDKSLNQDVKIDFSNFIHFPIKYATFTNFFRDSNEQKRVYNVFFNQFLPNLQGKTIHELVKEPHNHEIDSEKLH